MFPLNCSPAFHRGWISASFVRFTYYLSINMIFDSNYSVSSSQVWLPPAVLSCRPSRSKLHLTPLFLVRVRRAGVTIRIFSCHFTVCVSTGSSPFARPRIIDCCRCFLCVKITTPQDLGEKARSFLIGLCFMDCSLGRNQHSTQQSDWIARLPYDSTTAS